MMGSGTLRMSRTKSTSWRPLLSFTTRFFAARRGISGPYTVMQPDRHAVRRTSQEARVKLVVGRQHIAVGMHRTHATILACAKHHNAGVELCARLAQKLAENVALS